MQPPAAVELLAKGGPHTLFDRPLIRGARGVVGAVSGLWFLHLPILGLSEAGQSPSEGGFSRLRDCERPLRGAPWFSEPKGLSGHFQRQELSLRPVSQAAGAGDAAVRGWTALTGVARERGERLGWCRGAGGGLQSSTWSLATSSLLIHGAAQAGPSGLAPNRDSSQKDGV